MVILRIKGGGGVCYGCVYNSVIKQNTCYYQGGGAYYVNVYDSLISENSVINHNGSGGGTAYGFIYRCNIVSNSGDYGGGASKSYLYNCLVAYNKGVSGGGAYTSSDSYRINNCTIVNNVATNENGFGCAGGVYGYTIQNSIIYNNVSRDYNNIFSSVSKYNCTYPMPSGVGNITNNPEFADCFSGNFGLSSDSLCINAGSNGLVNSSIDILGNPRIINGTVDMGAYEYLAASIGITNQNVIFPGSTTSTIIGGTNNPYCAGGFWWTNISMGTCSTVNRSADSNSWSALIDNLIEGNNEVYVYVTNVEGIVASDSITIKRTAVDPGVSPVHYVSPFGGSVWPYTNWVSAATNIQTAINTATPGDMILVTNGIYDSGKYVRVGNVSSCRILITNNVVVKSVNGAEGTFIVGEGYQGGYEYNTRCVRMTKGTLFGFTLSNGWTRHADGNAWNDLSGGGVNANESFSAVISNCIIRSCNATQNGAGCYKGNYYNCLIIENRARTYGGGGSGGAYYNCTIAGNESVISYDGVSGWPSTANLYNCIVYSNGIENYSATVNLENCCTFPMPLTGTGNITNDPQFISLTGKNYRLQLSSKCIDEGNNAYAPMPFDLAGNQRIFDGVVDIGAYEYIPEPTMFLLLILIFAFIKSAGRI